jgi:hypothetical protein
MKASAVGMLLTFNVGAFPNENGIVVLTPDSNFLTVVES